MVHGAAVADQPGIDTLRPMQRQFFPLACNRDSSPKEDAVPDPSTTTTATKPRRVRQRALRDLTSYPKVIRNAFIVGLVVAFAIWMFNPFNLKAHVSGGRLINDFMLVVPVVIASIAIEIEHCRRWGYTRALARMPGAVFFGIVWVAFALLGYLVGQQPAFLVLDSLTPTGYQPAYAVRVTVAIVAAVSSLGGVALIWLLRTWLSERRRLRGPQLFAEVAEIFAGVLSMLNRIVHLFTGLVYVAGGVLMLMGLKLGSDSLSALVSTYIPYWMQTAAAVAGVVAACFFLAKGFQRLLRAASLRPGAMPGPHGSAYTATASDLRRAGILH